MPYFRVAPAESEFTTENAKIAKMRELLDV
jgi:hypothetical protein